MTFYRPTPFEGELSDLPRYVNQELGRLSAALALDAGAASLYRVGAGTAIQIGTTPVLIDEWQGVTPIRYVENCIPSLDDSAIYLRREGIWMASFTITADIEKGRKYEVQVFVNDVATQLVAFVDPSNQTDVVTMTATGSARLDLVRGQNALKVDVRVFADAANADWQTLGGYFSVWWVSD